ncbi:MAG: hypothetical protein IT385_16370 [Deltaproteobacteria bacterium]|nr:hypothetical protein [Deltaproteobacteria bacterium]
MPVRPVSSRALAALASLVAPLSIVTLACGDDSTGAGDTVADTSAEIVFVDTIQPDAVPLDSLGTDAPDAAETTEPPLCAVAGGFGCPCSNAIDCLDGLCVEGPDGSLCTRACDAMCPAGMDCLLTAIGGDPRTICVPRHTRLCRPCDAASDCTSALDPDPGACIPGDAPSDGSFCATSCATSPCPDGYACQDVAVGQASARLCRPIDLQGEARACECRPAWADLALSTSCHIDTCPGVRTCGPTGITPCTSSAPEGADCCGNASDCPASEYGSASVCHDAATCSGTRVDPICDESVCAVGGTVDDDSGCLGQVANDCGWYRSVLCTGAQVQAPPVCPEACDGDDDCDPGAYCGGGACVPDEGTGGVCGDDGQCGPDLQCVDGRCCGTACAGACQRCDLPGSEGACSPITRGVDPDDECPALQCLGYYWGYDGKVCYRRGAVTDSGVACDGGGACQTAEDVCPTAARGPEASACHAECQVPKAGTCQGTTPGGCNDIPGGTRTCGEGACAVTVTLCTGGDYSACVPGEPAPEVCDGVDNDCDGLTDAEDDTLVVDACDKSAGVCAGTLRTADLCVGGKWQACPDDYYAANSPYYEAGTEASCEGVQGAEGLDNDCDGDVDEDFVWVAPNGSTVTGAGEICGLGRCAGGYTLCGRANQLICSSEGAAEVEVCNQQDDDCDGLVDALDASLIRPLCELQAGVCLGAQKPATLCALGQWQTCQAAAYLSHSGSYQATEASCDGLDNDCKDGIDTNLGAGPLNTNQLGVCAGSRQRCEGPLGWRDYSSAQTITSYDPNESLPDGNYRDENCDGVDGNATLAHFVTSGGSGTSCTRQSPCSLTQALSSNTKAHIYVQAGTYAPPGQTTFNVGRVVKLFGGYDGAWNRAARTTHPVDLLGGYWGGEAMTLRVAGVGSAVDPVVIADVNLGGAVPNGAGKSSYVIWSKGSHLRLERVTLAAASGAAGAAGGAGTHAASLSAPGKGTDGNPATYSTSACDTSWSAGGGGAYNDCAADPAGGYSQGGGGGGGGQMDAACQWCGACYCIVGPDTCGATSGSWGGGGWSTQWSTDGGAGAGAGTCNPGGGGGAGGSSHGGRGAAASTAYGSIVSDLFVAASGGAGSIGAHGGGGGGGGGAGGCDAGSTLQNSRGGGGGGGGAGGCRARAAGTGGSGGGGSFGVFAIDSFLSIQSSIINRGNGGAGGQGGAGGHGQPGGAGGAGGAAAGSAKIGGAGGAGGQGGHSGGGGGGAGGASFGVYWYRSSAGAGGLTQSGNNFGTNASGGAAGPGGTGAISSVTGESGPVGAAGSVCERTGSGCAP